MGLIYTIEYKEEVLTEDLPRISTTDKKRIKAAIEQKLTIAPEVYGKPLRTSLKGRRSLRVGNYRVIYTITNSKVTIYAIGHRKDVYEELG